MKDVKLSHVTGAVGLGARRQIIGEMLLQDLQQYIGRERHETCSVLIFEQRGVEQLNPYQLSCPGSSVGRALA